MGTVDHRGHAYHLHPPGEAVSDCVRKGAYEIGEMNVLESCVQKGMVTLDVGANIGTHTLEMARLVGPEGLVISVEPDPTNYKLLQRNVVENGYANVWTIRAALGDRCGETELWLDSGGNLGDHRTWECNGTHTRKIKVRQLTLDALMGRLGLPLDFIKVDVQGMEGKVLAGGMESLKAVGSGGLLMEFWFKGIQAVGNTWQEIDGWLHEAGYDRTYAVDERLNDLIDMNWCGGLKSFFDGRMKIINNAGVEVPNDFVLVNLLFTKRVEILPLEAMPPGHPQNKYKAKGADLVVSL